MNINYLLEKQGEGITQCLSIFGNKVNQSLSLFVTRDGIIMSHRWSERQIIEIEGNWSPMLSGFEVNTWKLLTNS